MALESLEEEVLSRQKDRVVMVAKTDRQKDQVVMEVEAESHLAKKRKRF